MEERTKKILEIRINNPCATLQQIGNQTKLTRERVRQILNKHGLPTHHYHQRKQYTCLNCGKIITTDATHFCSRKCRHNYSQITVICSECNESFVISKTDLIARTKRHIIPKMFCSKTCFGRWVGKNHGPKHQNKERVLC